MDIIDAVIASFGSGISQPPTQIIISLLKDENKFDISLELEVINKIDGYFKKIIKK